MSVKNKTNKNDKRSQKGRSMVEMLGVLAIIGVLSVGGVYGYGVAMKKHKANELLHQASMLAATISAQAMTNNGTLPQTITDFGNTSYGKFQSDVGETADKTGFTITISELDGSVCSQLKEGGMVQKVECNETAKTATLTYYKNLATTEAEGEKSPTGGSENKEPVIDKTSQEWLNCMEEQTDGNWGKTLDEICSCIVPYSVSICDCVFGNNYSVELCQCMTELIDQEWEADQARDACNCKADPDCYPCEAERREIDWDEQDNPIDYVSLPKGKAQEVYTEKGRSYECGYCDDCSMSGWFWFYIEPEYPY